MSPLSLIKLLLITGIICYSGSIFGQCQWYTITVTDSPLASEVSWELIDDTGTVWVAGGAPYSGDICLPDGCYTLLMYDSGGQGWQDEDWFIQDWIGDFDWDTNLSDGYHGMDTLDLGNNGCDTNPTGGPLNCPTGTNPYSIIITSGTDPTEVSWNIGLNGNQLIGGGAPFNDTLCLADGCYFLYMNDSGGDGWEGSTYLVEDELGVPLVSGTMTNSTADTLLVNIGGLDCSASDPGGTDPGLGCGSVQPSSDCSSAPCVCDPYTFNISPSGFGTLNEIPSPGSVSNPSYNPFNPPPWGGTDYGCLLAGELNSSWMMFTVATSGTLEFVFGGGGQQIGYYDWAMWEYLGSSTCTGIANNSVSPVRCVWNAVSYGGTGISDIPPPGGDPGNFAPSFNVTAGQQFIICLSNWSYVTTSVTLDFTGTAGILCSLILPIELQDFSVVESNGSSLLEWVTLSEINNHHFEIEHSLNNLDWSHIGTVSGMDTTQLSNHYSFTHEFPARGWNYYRLKQVNDNGEATYSDVKALWIETPADVLIYPNPANSHIQINLPGSSQSLEVYDYSGRLVHHSMPSPDQPYDLDISKWPNGLYMIQIVSGSRILTEPFIINHH